MELSSKELYQLLKEHYGEIDWWPADSTYERMVGAILVQNTNWSNVQIALDRLKAATELNPQTILSLDQDQLIDLIRPAGFFKNKSRGILAMTDWLHAHHYDYVRITDKYDERLSRELLQLPNVGPETADVYLLYAFDQIEFVADRYAQKLYSSLGVEGIKDYQSLKNKVSMEAFDLPEAQAFHALIVEFGKHYLRGARRFEESFLSGGRLIHP